MIIFKCFAAFVSGPLRHGPSKACPGRRRRPRPATTRGNRLLGGRKQTRIYSSPSPNPAYLIRNRIWVLPGNACNPLAWKSFLPLKPSNGVKFSVALLSALTPFIHAPEDSMTQMRRRDFLKKNQSGHGCHSHRRRGGRQGSRRCERESSSRCHRSQGARWESYRRDGEIARRRGRGTL